MTTPRTVVFQTFRRTDVPDWVTRCLRSAEAWARDRKYDYHFFGDEFFNLVPPWYLKKSKGNKCFITNLARLIQARRFLQAGYDRAIWIDADIIVFAPDQFEIPIVEGYAFCHEVWIDQHPEKPHVSHKVNNSVTVAVKGNNMLDYFIPSLLRIAKSKPRVNNLELGTLFLSKVRSAIPFPLLTNVGMLSPSLMAALANGNIPFIRAFAEQLSGKLAAANICGSYRNAKPFGISMTDELYAKVMDMLESTRGEVVNQYFTVPLPKVRQSVLFQYGLPKTIKADETSSMPTGEGLT